MEKFINREVADLFKAYPKNVQAKMYTLRQLIFDTAKKTVDGEIEESIKWGEPSYAVKGGSPIRIDWKSKCPDQFAMYFNCKTKLVDTFREMYGDSLKFEGNRAIILMAQQAIPKNELGHCIQLALTKHKRKNLPLLGA